MIRRLKSSSLSRVVTMAAVVAFLLQPIFALFPGTALAQALNLPTPGSMISTSPQYKPVLLNGVIIHPDNPLMFDFIVTKGDANLKAEAFKKESTKIIKYFLASLTIPEKDLWVNLSPYEKDRIIPDSFGVTEMGRDLLAQDYILKQLTASIVYPESDLGKEFWKKVYRQAADKYGVADLPVNAFNKVWILPDHALVYEDQTKAVILNSHLKVMLEEDYLLMKNNLNNVNLGTRYAGEKQIKDLSSISSQVVREIVIPAIEKEVNEGKNFANLRQVYQSLILATWFKKRLQESLLGQIYVNQNRISGVDVHDKTVKQRIYEQYVEAFKKGVYNYIKEDYDATTGKVIPRKYFSGGFWGGAVENSTSWTSDQRLLTENERSLDGAVIERTAINPQVTGPTSAWSKRLKSLAAGMLMAWGVSQTGLAEPVNIPYNFSIGSQNYYFGPNLSNGGEFYSYGNSQALGAYTFVPFTQSDIQGQSLLLIRPYAQNESAATFIYLYNGKIAPMYFGSYRGTISNDVNIEDVHWYYLARLMASDKDHLLSGRDFQDLMGYWSNRVSGLATSGWFIRPEAAQRFTPALGSGYASPVTFTLVNAQEEVRYDGGLLRVNNLEALADEGKVIAGDGSVIGDYSVIKYEDELNRSKGVLVATLTPPSGVKRVDYYFFNKTTNELIALGSLPFEKQVVTSSEGWQKIAEFIDSPLGLSKESLEKAKLAFQTMEFQSGYSFYDGMRGTFSFFYFRSLLQALGQHDKYQFAEGYTPFLDLAFSLSGLNLADQQELVRQLTEVWGALSFDVRTQVLSEFLGMDASVLQQIAPLLVEHMTSTDEIYKVRQLLAPKFLADLDFSNVLVRILNNPAVDWGVKQSVLETFQQMLLRSTILRVPYLNDFFLDSLAALNVYGQTTLTKTYGDTVIKIVQKEINYGVVEDLQDIGSVLALTKYVPFPQETIKRLQQGIKFLWQDDLTLLPGVEHYYTFASTDEIERLAHAVRLLPDNKVLNAFVRLMGVPFRAVSLFPNDQETLVDRAVNQLVGKSSISSLEVLPVVEKLSRDGIFDKYASKFFPLLERYNPQAEGESDAEYQERLDAIRKLFTTHHVILRDLEGGTVKGKLNGTNKTYIDLMGQSLNDSPNTVFFIDLMSNSLASAAHGYIRVNYSATGDNAVAWVTDFRHQLGRAIRTNNNRNRVNDIILVYLFEQSASMGKGFISPRSSENLTTNYEESFGAYSTQTSQTLGLALSEMEAGRAHQLNLFMNIAMNLRPAGSNTNTVSFFSLDNSGNVATQAFSGAWDSGDVRHGVFRMKIDDDTYVVAYDNLLISSATKLNARGQAVPLAAQAGSKDAKLANISGASLETTPQPSAVPAQIGLPVAMQSEIDRWTRLSQEDRLDSIPEFQKLFEALLDSGRFFDDPENPAFEFFRFMMEHNQGNPDLTKDPTLPERIRIYQQRAQWHREIQQQAPSVVPSESPASDLSSANNGLPETTPGGIDFNPAHLHLDIETKGMGQAMPTIAPSELQDLQIEGFTPVILEFRPFNFSLLTESSPNSSVLTSLPK